MSAVTPVSSLAPQPNTPPAIQSRISAGEVTWGRTAIALVFRTAGFLCIQAMIALAFAWQGSPTPWESSAAYWPLSAMVAGAANLALLVILTGREGLRYTDLLSFSRATMGRDVLIVLGLTLLAGPIAMAPMMGLSTLLFGDSQAASLLLVRPLPTLLAAVSILLLPLSIALVELPTYFGYAMPRLESLSGRAWVAVVVPALFLGLQHATLPFLFDWRFVVWRAGMFLPFALLLGLVLHWRPRLMPYLMVFHFLIDMATAWFIWVVSAAA